MGEIEREALNQLGRFISDVQFNRVFVNLVKLSLIEHHQKGYTIADPVLREVSKNF